ncbi:hypothetical protein YC2023_046008 [Brassica napus]
MAVGNPVMQRMLSERRAALGLPIRDPQDLRVLYNESIYVCFTSKPLRGVYHEILRLIYDEKVPCALRRIYFVVNLTSHLRRNLRYDGRFTTKRLSRLIRRNTPFTTNLQRILPS